jgi:hypothetical protein
MNKKASKIRKLRPYCFKHVYHNRGFKKSTEKIGSKICILYLIA